MTRASDREGRARALELTHVSRETAERLDAYVALITRWQTRINLIGPDTLPDIWIRHIADSLQLLTLAPGALRWMDLGSGAGLPGLVVACALAGREGARVDLVESNSKKAAFLAEAIRVTGAPAVVHRDRIENVVPHWREPVDVVTARALAPLPRLFAHVAPLVENGAQALFLKGQDVDRELTEAAISWTFEMSDHPSLTAPDARILRIGGLRRRRAAGPESPP